MVHTQKTQRADTPMLWKRMEMSWVGVVGMLCFFLAYGPHLMGAYVWDDVYLVQYHPALRSAEGWRVLWMTDLWGGATGRSSQLYHPLPMWSFWLEARWWGLEVHKARLINGLLHGGGGVLLWGLLRRWLGWRLLAWLGAFLFWLHPLMTETVMWLTGRHDGLAVFLAMLALWLWPIDGRLRWRTLFSAVLASLCCAGALLCKEPYLVLPLLLALLPWCLSHSMRRVRWSLVLSILPMFAVFVVFVMRRSLGISSESAQSDAPIMEHLQHFFSIGLRYAVQLFSWQGAPTIAPYTPMPAWLWVSGAAVVGCVMVWVVWRWRRSHRQIERLLVKGGVGKEGEGSEDVGVLGEAELDARAWGVILWGLVAYGLCWVPHLLSMPMIGLWGNRYAYFPWVLLVIVAMGWAVVMREAVSVAMRRVVGGMAVLLLIWGGLATAKEAGHWKDNWTLYRADVMRDPSNGRAMYHFAHAVRMRGGCQQAAGLFLRAAHLDPTYLRSWQNAAGCLLEIKRYREALEPARQAVKRAPSVARMRYNLALALFFTKQHSEALTEVTEALALSPDYAPAQRLFFALQTLPTSRPSSALSRPSSALSHPSSALSRPSSALSRPSSPSHP